jgi:D-cysteine desulfhydrase/L-cysteate sulfo-lyase
MSQILTLPDLRESVERVPRFPLAHLPTPFEFLKRFSKILGGPRIFIKRDDCTGLAMGGNKTRHNEYLMADALRKGSDLFVWGAGVQSNNCRQTVAACIGDELDRQIEERANQFRARGRKVYFWDREVVKPLAAIGYVACLIEILEQSSALGFTPDAVYVSSAGSTGSGLAIAAKALGCRFPVRNICPIKWEWDTQADMADIGG